MTDVLTTAKGLTQQAIGSHLNAWGTVLNNNLGLIDAALGGTLVKALTGNVTLTGTEARNTGYVFTGVIGSTATVIFPGYYGMAVLQNETNQSVTCGILGGTVVTVPSGFTDIIWSDGTNFKSLVNVSEPNSMTLVGSYTGVGNSILNVSFTLDDSLVDGSVHPTFNQISITTTVNGQDFWTNYDAVDWNVSGGDNTAGADVVARYMQVTRSTATPSSVASASVSSVVDATNAASSVAGGIVLHELNMACNDADDDANRQGLLITLVKDNVGGANPHADSAIHITGPTSGAWRVPVYLDCRYTDAVIDLRSAISDGGGGDHGIWLGDDHDIAFDTPGSSTMAYVGANSRIEVTGSVYFGASAIFTDIETDTVPVTHTATGGSDTLPANPVGFLTITIDGTAQKIPFYAV